MGGWRAKGVDGAAARQRTVPPGGGAGLQVGRRVVLLGGGGAVLGACLDGCTSGGGTPRSATSDSGTSGSATSGSGTPTSAAAGTGSSPSPVSTLPAPTPWRPGPGEIRPAVKVSAVRLVEAFGTWGNRQGGEGQRAKRAEALGIGAARAGELAGQSGSLTPVADQAVVGVIDAQYGGILADSASVLVVCRQWTKTGGAVKEGGTTVDVRLSRTAEGWEVTELHPARPGGPAARLGAAARAVLTDKRISLPPASYADVRSGAVHDSVLRAMLRLAGTYELAVSVVRSGHPLDVFGTDRPSDHPPGRAFDVWRIDGHPVVDPATSRGLITAFMRAAAAAGSYNVGGPVQLSGGATANQFFSDDTHHDHVHVGFTG